MAVLAGQSFFCVARWATTAFAGCSRLRLQAAGCSRFSKAAVANPSQPAPTQPRTPACLTDRRASRRSVLRLAVPNPPRQGERRGEWVGEWVGVRVGGEGGAGGGRGGGSVRRVTRDLLGVTCSLRALRSENVSSVLIGR